MSEITNESLKKIGKGTVIALVGTGAGLLLAFITRIIIARYGTDQYGIFSLALVVLNISILIATLGLQSGAARHIAYFRGKGETTKVQGTISASIQFATLASILFGLVIFFTSDVIATKIFHNAELILPLKILAFGIPFSTIISVFVSVFRGFERVQEKVYFQDILINALFLLLLLPIFFLHLPFSWIFYAYLVSLAFCALTLVLYTTRRLPVRLTVKPSVNAMGKELLLFSLPLLGVAILGMIISWTDILMLGYFKTSDAVGLYNAANPLAQLTYFFSTAMLFIYVPVTTTLYAQNLLPEIRRSYTIVTKWIFSLALPLILIFILFPENVLVPLFGANYVAAGQALQILCLGSLIVNLLGPNCATLIAIGETRFLMWASIAAAGINVILNIALIPQWGIVGAAIATATSLALYCIIRHVKVHRLLRVNPLTKKLLKPAIISTGLIFLISFLVKNFFDVTPWMLLLLFVLFYALHFMVTLFSRSFDQEDIMILTTIENRVGIDVTPIKKILRRFL